MGVITERERQKYFAYLDGVADGLNELSRDMEEIAEVINCDADAEAKCRMISNILTAKPHYFEKQEPSGDAVSRQAVAEQMIKYGFLAPDMTVTEFVEDLPPVDPQKSGHWIDCSNGWMCSECHKDNTYDTDFCPNCGAKMEVADEDSD